MTTPDLPPAAEAARQAWVTAICVKPYVPGSGYVAVVDAVVAVVAPEIERPLQARIEELEAVLKFIAEDGCAAPSWVKTNCLDESPSDLCPVCTARAVLVKGEKP